MINRRGGRWILVELRNSGGTSHAAAARGPGDYMTTRHATRTKKPEKKAARGGETATGRGA